MPVAAPSAPAIDLPRLVELRDVAIALSISEEGVRRLVRKRALAVVRVDGCQRFRPQDVQAYIDAHHVPALPEERHDRAVQPFTPRVSA